MSTDQTYGVQAAPLSESIHVGRLNKARTMFLDKEDGTDMVLAAVAQYVERHFADGMEADFPGLGLRLTVHVSPITDSTEEDPVSTTPAPSRNRLSSSGPEPFEACPDGGRCWHECPLLPASAEHPEGEGLPCWRVANAVPLSGHGDRWTPAEKARHAAAGPTKED